MKYPTENSKKYPGLEQLSTPELEELLRQDLVTSEDDDASMALITEIMEVIDARETQIPSPIDADTAWQTFLARNVTHTTAFGSPDTSLQEVTEPPSSNVVSFPSTEPPKRRKKLRWFISFAAVLCLLTCFLTISATGKDVTKFLVEWSNHTFSFMPDELSVSRLDSADYDQMKSKVATLTDLPVLPTRYPAGADLMQIEDNPAFMSEGVTFVFSSPRGGFSISVNVFHSASENSSGQYEKNPGPLEEYYVGGIPHYIAKNIDTYTAVWRNENLECSIQGDLSIDQLKAMIDSIYNNYGE